MNANETMAHIAPYEGNAININLDFDSFTHVLLPNL